MADLAGCLGRVGRAWLGLVGLWAALGMLYGLTVVAVGVEANPAEGLVSLAGAACFAGAALVLAVWGLGPACSVVRCWRSSDQR
ncbi:MAG: hypothetical protein ACTHOG_04435 [Marmoricola sp.]